ncbi:MAG: hypothetical protein ACM31O_14035 [Bacteroidota bacterium]
MKTIDYIAVADKSDWGDGPWMSEPDKRQWVDKATGLPCLIVRNSLGALCGYVGVSKSHPAYGKDYFDVDVRVHGGLTFARQCAPKPTREMWEEWRRMSRETAQAHPRSHRAHALAKLTRELDDYDAFLAWVEASSVCHKVEPGEDDDVWWLGFDCGHVDDLCPSDRYVQTGAYRDFAYVTAQVRSLAAQLAALDGNKK